MEQVVEAFDERLPLILNGLFLSFIATWIAVKNGFYTLPAGGFERFSSLTFKNVLAVFLLFFLVNLIILPLVIVAWFYFKEGRLIKSTSSLSHYDEAWINIIGLFLMGAVFFIYCCFLKPSLLKDILKNENWRDGKRLLSDLSFGLLTWFVCFPLVFLLGQLLGFYIDAVFNPPEMDQVAVKHLKSTFENPWQFWMSFMGIIFVGPAVEELIFRGFLQTWLKNLINIPSAIIASSIVFACFHYSSTQGIHNLELLPSLFLLSCYLGYIYERQRSIWAPMALHAFFNFVSICMIVWQTSQIKEQL